jgi:hypothetical protein
MSLAKTCKKIQSRTKASDVFYTPSELVDESIKMSIDGAHTINETRYSNLYCDDGDWDGNLVRNIYWYDPFKGLGAYYNKFPSIVDAYSDDGGCEDHGRRIACKKDWAEIVLGKDFYRYTPEWEEDDIKIICSNPPYSCLNAVVMRCIELNPDIINLTLGSMNLTRTRINLFKINGYTLSKITITDVKGWFGITNIVQFEKTCNSPTTSCNYLVRDDGKAFEYKPEIAIDIDSSYENEKECINCYSENPRYNDCEGVATHFDTDGCGRCYSCYGLD